jgi:hypothetical protein
MIAITTDNGTLRIAGELSIPNGQNWSPGRIQRLMMEIERYVFISELVDKDLPKSNGRIYTPPLERKPNSKSGLVIDA